MGRPRKQPIEPVPTNVTPLRDEEPKKNPRGGQDQQVNFRAYSGQIAFWQEAAVQDGFNSIGMWLKWLATKRATEVFEDKQRGGKR